MTTEVNASSVVSSHVPLESRWGFAYVHLHCGHVTSGLPMCYLSRGYLHPFLDVFGIFSPPLHQLRGYHSVIQAASPSQVMSEDSKSYFECSIWILTVKCNAHGFSRYYNFQSQITMLENIGYTTELTAWHFHVGHMSGTCV